MTPPSTFRGIEQLPVTGHSFASRPRRRRRARHQPLQYFEMAGSRALVAGSGRRCASTQGADFDTEPWELYHLATDASECHDLAADHPEQLAELVGSLVGAGRRHGVLPLDDRGIELFGARFRDRSPHPAVPALRVSAADVADPRTGVGGDRRAQLRPHRPRHARRRATTGVLFATGTENSGISVFVQDDRLVVDYNAFDDHTILESDVAVPTGEADPRRRGSGAAPGRPGTIEIAVDGVDARPRRRGAVHADDLLGRLRASATTTARRCRPATALRSPSPATCTRSSSSWSRQPTRGPRDAEAAAEMSRQ